MRKRPATAFDEWADENGIPRDAYCLDGERNEAYCALAGDGDVWLVFYAERGLRTGVREFPTRGDALRALQERLLRDLRR